MTTGQNRTPSNAARKVCRPQLTTRLYAGEGDLVAMQRLLMEARSRTGDWRYWHVGELMWSFFLVTCHLDAYKHVRLWFDGDRLAGYAILGEDPTFDWQVLPEHEWCGIEEEALAWAEAQPPRSHAEDSQGWGDGLVANARQDDAKRIAFLEQHGFGPGDWAEINLRPLDEAIADPVAPAGFRIREVLAQRETGARAAAERDVWYPYISGNITGDDYGRLMSMPGYDRDLDMVAVAPHGAIAAYVNGWIDPVNRIGDLGPVGALPAYRRLGLSRAVSLECLRRMRARGMDRVHVSTGVTNAAALGLYQSVGFKPHNKWFQFKKPPNEHP